MSDPLKNKMFEYEAMPPEGVWSKIAGELEESNEFLPLSAKMFDFEVTPPMGSWQQITNALNTDESPRKSIRSLIYKLAAAAIFIGVVLTGSIYFLGSESVRDNVAVQPKKTNDSSKPTATPENNYEADEDAQASPQERIAYAGNTHHNSDKSFATASVSASGYRSLKKVPISDASLDRDPDISVPVRPIRNESGDIIQDQQIIANGDDEYISVTGPNGQQTRISAKFIDALLYLNGNDSDSDYGYADARYYESESWQRKFQEWRNKIMQTSYIPSSTNFLDIMEFKELILKDNPQ